jgi:phage terminase large subunit-like protein
VRKGSQKPRIESYPLFHTTAGDDAIDLAAVAGLVMDPWQEHILRASLGERRDGKWAAFRACVVVPRQNGKNALLEARELAGMFLFNEKLIFHTAHEFKTTKESMRSLMQRIKDAPELLEQVAGFDEGEPDKDLRGMKTGNSDPSITLKNGNRLVYAARSKGSGRGFTGDLVVLDEAYALKIEEIAALVPTMAAKSLDGNPQIWFTSSAGMPDSDLLASYRKQGIDKSSDRLAYFEWSADEDAASDDRRAWYRANPGLGYRISEEFIQDELDTFVLEDGDDKQFRRERLGIWEKLGGESIFPTGVWAKQAAPDAAIVRDPIIAVDMRTGLKQCFVVAAAGADADGAGLVHIVHYETGINAEWSEDYVVDETCKILDKRGIGSVAVDNLAENELLIRKFEDRGVRVVKLNTRDMANGAVSITDALVNRRVHHTNNEHLNAAVAGAVKRTYGQEGLYLWSQPKSTVDITALRAATEAWWVYQSIGDYDVDDSFY